MPIYAIRCSHCGERQDVYRALKEYDNLPEHCGERMQRMVTAPYVQADIQPYQSMVTGEMITSRSQHRSHLKQHGKIEVGNEQMPASKPVVKDDIKRDIAQVLNGYGY